MALVGEWEHPDASTETGWWYEDVQVCDFPLKPEAGKTYDWGYVMWTDWLSSDSVEISIWEYNLEE